MKKFNKQELIFMKWIGFVVVLFSIFLESQISNGGFFGFSYILVASMVIGANMIFLAEFKLKKYKSE